MNQLSERMKTSVVTRWAVILGLGVPATLFVTQVVMPGNGSGRGTPAAILYAGLAIGTAGSLLAAGLVFMHRTLRIINLAQAATGIFGAVAFWDAVQYTKLPFVACLVIGIATAAGAGLLIGLYTLRFFHGSRLFLTVVTIVMAQVAGQFASRIQTLPFTPHPTDRGAAAQELAQNPDALLPFSGWRYTIGSLEVRYGFPQVFAIELAVLGMLGLAAFFRFTRSGIAVRALAENPERASLLGISTGKLSLTVWTVSGALGGCAMIAVGAARTPGQAAGYAISSFLPAITAAILVGMRSIPGAIAAMIGLSVLEQAWEYSLPSDMGLYHLLLLGLILLGLAIQRRSGRSEKGGTVGWVAAEEVRPIPSVLLAVPGVRIARTVGIAALVALPSIFPFVADTRQIVVAQGALIMAILGVSLVVLTGWSGQVSLGQYGFAGIGAVVASAISVGTPLTFWVAAPAAAVVTGIVAIAIGIPALRIRGLFLLAATLAMAVVVQSVLFAERYFGWLLPDSAPKRPTMFVLDFENEESMYFLCLAGLVLVVVMVTGLRRSRIGRILIAVRENEESLAAFGVNVVRTKLLAFALSGGIAGFAGALLTHQARDLDAGDFGPFDSITLFIVTILGGIGAVGGGILGALWQTTTQDLFTSALLQQFFALGGVLFVLQAIPGGFMSVFTRGRDAVLRIVAQRRQIVVPSLVRGYDDAVAASRLLPLTEPEAGSGLRALDPSQRWARQSDLYRWRRSEAVTAQADRDALAAVGALGEETSIVDEDGGAR